MRKFLTSTLAACALFVAPAEAATLIVQGGILQGATGVLVEGQSYDVEFIEATCASAFSGCDNISDFTFTSAGSAFSAAFAILDQVAVNNVQGFFDSRPETVFGCFNPAFATIYGCNIYVPYGFSSSGSTLAVGAANVSSSSGTSDSTFAHPGIRSDFDTALSDGAVWARFSLTSAVPEPATWTMMILGFGAIGAALRSRRRSRHSIARA